MLLLLILPVLVSGFIVCNGVVYHYFRLHRIEGQHLYLKSAFLGLRCLLIFFVISSVANAVLPDIFSILELNIPLNLVALITRLLDDILLDSTNESKLIASWVIVYFFGVILVAYAWVWVSKVINKFRFKTLENAKIIEMGALLADSPIDALFYQSYVEQRRIIVTLENNKVYIGVVATLGEPNEEEGADQEIAIIPLLSGYRDKDTHILKLTTNYKNVAGKDVSLIIRQDKIISACWYDESIYQQIEVSAAGEVQSDVQLEAEFKSRPVDMKSSVKSLAGSESEQAVETNEEPERITLAEDTSSSS